MSHVEMKTTLVDVTESANWRVEHMTTQAIGHGFYALTSDQEKPTHFFMVYQRGVGPKGSASEWEARLTTTSLDEVVTLLRAAKAKADSVK